MTDNETERARLARIYAGLSDVGLSELTEDAKSLTDVAREVLNAELSRRGMEPIRAPEREENTDAAMASVDDERAREYSGPLVMVKRFRDLPEAFVAKSVLDSAQIDSFLADENIVRMDWLYSNLVGGAKLMVRPEDVAEATALLDESANGAGAAKDSGETDTSNAAGETDE